ncbi:hypothetical protein AALO_G00156190 [Alosa alosa]|uniref:Uncharacterized protein n=1 Tax=Alosa alosa TaxID=278164 RepID=A0AAV6GIK7_9TELE|nr:hypothetical protein AALO_G00156190 [Alosa alosa]
MQLQLAAGRIQKKAWTGCSWPSSRSWRARRLEDLEFDPSSRPSRARAASKLAKLKRPPQSECRAAFTAPGPTAPLSPRWVGLPPPTLLTPSSMFPVAVNSPSLEAPPTPSSSAAATWSLLGQPPCIVSSQTLMVAFRLEPRVQSPSPDQTTTPQPKPFLPAPPGLFKTPTSPVTAVFPEESAHSTACRVPYSSTPTLQQ